METLQLTKVQNYILSTIIEEKKEKNSSSYAHSVWFWPIKGNYLFMDKLVESKEIESLISSGDLKFIGLQKHQGENMLRYSTE